MFFSFSTFFNFLAIFQVVQCKFLIFSRFSVFFAIFQVLAGDFLIFFVGQFSCHIPGPTGCISHFSRFSLYLALFHVLPCEFLIFHVFYCSLPYSKYYSACFSFCTFFTVSPHISVTTVCVSHFALFQCFSPY